MSLLEPTQSVIPVSNESITEWICNPDPIPPPPSTTSIPRLAKMEREKSNYEKYYVPKLVSIGPYHFGDKRLELFQKLKPHFTMRLLNDDKETLGRLTNKLAEPDRVLHLRKFYEEKPTADFSDKEFSKMMLLDSCFILYYVSRFFGGIKDCPELNRSQVSIVCYDLFLFENQIPFEVLTEVMKLTQKENLKADIEVLFDSQCLVRYMRRKRTCLQNLKVIRSLFCTQKDATSKGAHHENDEKPSHLLAALRGKHTKIVKSPKPIPISRMYDRWNFRNVSELVNMGISFKAIKETKSLTRIEFAKGCWGFSANVKLPPIIVGDGSDIVLLNMIAYETYCCSNIDDAWVTSYVSLLDSLIDDVDDVKVLRKAWVIENWFSTDKEVANLFNDIAASYALVPNVFAYWEVKDEIQKHYGSWKNILFSQLKNEYFKGPWAIFAFLGALIALILTAVQTYYTVWSPESKCDDLCQFLKMNHHL